MSSLASKLSRLTPPIAAPRREGAEPIGAADAVPTAAPRARPVQIVDRVHASGYRQGRVEVGLARASQAATVASLSLDDALAQVDTSRMLLVDTETTGLHGGVGTLPFVIGLAWFEGPSLVVRQLFLSRPGQERPLLLQLAERLAASSVLVTFNGKCFDWPLLRTRFVMNRVPVPPALPHLDLLHCARRVFKRRLGAMRLTDLEAQVLGFHREGDISGAEIPAVYFDWLRTGRPAAIERVLEHNAQDLISMAAVLAELCRRFECLGDDDPAEDCLSLARLFDRCDRRDRAERFALAAVERAAPADVRFDALVLLARLAVRRRAWGEASHWLEQATAVPGPRAPLAHLAYARVCEHGLKDFARAMHHAHAAAAAEAAEANRKRIERLARKASSVVKNVEVG